MNELAENTPVVEKKRSNGALAFFLIVLLPLPFCLFIYNFIVWSTEQSAIASSSLAQLAWAGVIGLGVQIFLMSLTFGLLWYFTSDDRFKGWYASLFAASLFGIPALILRALGPNNDQLGSILQFILAVVVAGVIIFLRKGKLTWNFTELPFGLLIAAFGIVPLTIYGSFGSPSDAILSLFAGLAFGLLAAVWMSDAENVLLNGVGMSGLVALLAASFGYDGSQLILIVLVSAFGFAIATLHPSRAAATVATGLIAFVGLAFFDPTELTIVLGDIAGLATKAVGIALLIGWESVLRR